MASPAIKMTELSKKGTPASQDSLRLSEMLPLSSVELGREICGYLAAAE